MADDPWARFLLQWALWCVFMMLVAGWLGRSRLRRRPLDARHLFHPIGTLIIGIICAALFATAVALQFIFPNKTVTWWSISICAAFAVFSLLLIIAFFLEEHEVSEEGIAFRNAVGIRKHLRWADMRAVRYSPTMKWFRLEAQSGTVARISIMLTGLPEFARLLLHKAPRQAIDNSTLDVLSTTAGGYPPSVWA